VGFTAEEDGTFWMSIEDYCKIYDMLFICKYNDQCSLTTSPDI